VQCERQPITPCFETPPDMGACRKGKSCVPQHLFTSSQHKVVMENIAKCLWYLRWKILLLSLFEWNKHRRQPLSTTTGKAPFWQSENCACDSLGKFMHCCCQVFFTCGHKESWLCGAHAAFKDRDCETVASRTNISLPAWTGQTLLFPVLRRSKS